MKKTKKVISLLLAITMLLSLLVGSSISAFAVDYENVYKISGDFEYYVCQFTDVDYEEAIMVAYNGNSKHVLIPEVIDGYPVRCLGSKTFNSGNILGMFEGNKDLESVVIPNTVIEIGDCVFEDCTALQNIVIPNSVLYIHTWTFHGCSSLQNITFPENLRTAALPFNDKCTSLKNIIVLSRVVPVDLRDFDTIPTDLTIYGFLDSQARKDAELYDVNFVAFEDEPIIPDKTNTEYIIGSNSNVSIHCAYPLNDFVSVEINDNLVDKANYTLSDGSTVLTFNSDYLDTLKAGSYNVKLNYIYTTVSTVLTIKDENTESNQTVSTVTSENNSSNTTTVNSNNTTKTVKSKNLKSPSTGLPNAVIAFSSAVLASGLAVIISRKKNYFL